VFFFFFFISSSIIRINMSSIYEYLTGIRVIRK